MSRKLHSRWERNIQAKLDVGNAVCKAMETHHLTHAELTMILAETLVSWSKSAVKQEREWEDKGKV